MNSNSVYNFMDVSTAHITAEDANKLENTELTVDSIDHGWWLHITTDVMERVIEEGFSISFGKMLEKAVSHNCRYILLSSDGDTHEDLHQHNW